MLILKPINSEMKIALYLGSDKYASDSRLAALMDKLGKSGCSFYRIADTAGIQEGTDILMSVGGDGTFLTAGMLSGTSGLPVLGVNLGRLGFLSENRPESVAEAVLSGSYTVEDRSLLKVGVTRPSRGEHFITYALNEITVHRSGAAMLGVDVLIDGSSLPTYWADGLLVATSSGSTAYSLSVGGPIVLPESKVLIIFPIAPHNLNVRPLIVPDSAEIRLGLRSRDEKVLLTTDNRNLETEADTRIDISLAQFSLKRVRLNSSNFINALTGKLFWGEDIRNGREQ